MINDKVLKRVQLSKSQGDTKEAVYIELLGAGYKVAEIEEAYLASLPAGVDTEAHHEEAQRKTIKVIIGFGVVLVAAGIFSIIASNWQEFSKLIKISIIYFFFFAAYFAGWRLTEYYNLPRIGKSMYYLGSLIFGGGIMLIGQMFNVSSNWPDAFLIWMLGIMVMAYFAQEFGLFFLALPIGLVAIAGYPVTFFADLSIFSGHNSLIMTSTVFLFIVSLSTFMAGAVVRRKVLSSLSQEDNY